MSFPDGASVTTKPSHHSHKDGEYRTSTDGGSKEIESLTERLGKKTINQWERSQILIDRAKIHEDYGRLDDAIQGILSRIVLFLSLAPLKTFWCLLQI